MSKITYQNTPMGSVIVLLDGKRVGSIGIATKGGYQYCPYGSACGEAYPTIEAVKRSLEGREP